MVNMKKTITLTLSLILAAMTFAQPDWTIDTDNVSIGWEHLQKGHTGTIGGLSGNILFDISDLENSKIDIVVDVTSLTADNKELEEHLKSEDYFDVKNYPVMKFASSSFSEKDDELVVTGLLNVHGTESEISIPFTYEETDEGAVFKGEFIVNNGAIGAGKSKTDEPNVKITIEVHVM